MYYKSWVLFIKDNFIKMVLISIYQNSSVPFVKTVGKRYLPALWYKVTVYCDIVVLYCTNYHSMKCIELTC